MRLVDWCLGLSLGQKIVVGVAVPALVFVVAYLASLLILSAAGVGRAGYSPQGGTPAPVSLRPGASASASSAPTFEVKIGSVRWEGEKAVVKGTWRGDLSSVHCDLLKGGIAGSAIDWWDRSVAAKTSFSKRTFSQEFVRAKGRTVKDHVDPQGAYWVVCWAQFSDGYGTGNEAPVKGTPPG